MKSAQMRNAALAAAAMLVVAASGAPSPDGTAASKPVYGTDGTAHVPAFDLPPSQFMSKEAVDVLKYRAAANYPVFRPGSDFARERRSVEALMTPLVQATLARYPVDIVEQTVAGVPTRVVTPKGGATDKTRILIDLHGGGFFECANNCALLESVTGQAP
jgi:hypothetical protein